MITEHKIDYYIGTIVAVVDNEKEKPNPEDKPIDELLEGHKSQEHIAIVTIPGMSEYIKAFPGRNQIDEPKIGDLAIVAVWDPIYHSYCTYEKLKENDFVGFRAHGKMVDITHDKITVGVFDESTEYKDEERPDCSKLAHIELTKEGAITVHAAKDITINADSNVTINIKGDDKVTIEGDANLSISGNLEAQVDGDATMKVSGSTEVNSPDVTITGGKLTVGGSCAPTSKGGFCAIPVCPLTGAPHIGDVISGT